MFKPISFLLATLFLVGCGGSDSDEPDNNSQQSVTLADVPAYSMKDTATVLNEVETHLSGLTINEFFEQSYLLTINRDDQNAISAGFADQFDVETVSLGNISDEYITQTHAVESKILEMLEQYDRSTLTTAQQLSYDIYHQHLTYQKEASQYIDFNYPATYGFFGWPGSTESFFTEVYVITNLKQAQIYLALLNQIQRRFSQIETLLDARRAKNIIEPRITFEFSKNAVTGIGQMNATQTSYYQAFEQQLNELSDVSAEQKQELMAQLSATIEQRVLPAYQSLGEKMNSMLSSAPNTIGFGQFDGGKEFYQSRLRYYTSSDRTPDEIHELGLAQLAIIHAEMKALFAKLEYPEGESLSASYSRVAADAGTIAAGQVKANYESLIDDAYGKLDEAFSLLPEQEVVVIGGDSGGYYIGGTDDGSRPGAFYANTSQNLPYTTMPTLTYHEAVPGHHLQIALANELDLPLFQRKITFTNFVEGWALYAERLAKDLGWYSDDPYGDLGRLQFEALRAARLVIDTGIHVKGWSYQEADDFHVENVGHNGSIARYSIWPGQATAYTTGMLKILELRQRAIDELGDKYDIKDFHAVVIGSGSMPLNTLEQTVERYIMETKSAE